MKVVSALFDENRIDTGLACKDKSLAQQHLAEECDINNIIHRYEQTGLITHVANKVAQYGDFSGDFDFAEAMNKVRSAEAMFMALPATIRERSDNDPGKLIMFLQDPKNREEGVKLGLLEAVPAKGNNPPASNNTPVEQPGKGLPEDSTPTPAPVKG